MRFSIRLNNDLDIPTYIALGQEAERQNFDQFWVSNDLFFRSAPVILTAVALNTSRIKIGSCILNPYTINPSEIAMLAATLNEASNGRLMLGISSGAAEFLDWVGLKHNRPVSELRESIHAIRTLLNNSKANQDGNFLRWSDEAYLRFPVEREIPIYIGGMGPNMLALSGEVGDGVLPLLFPPEHYYAACQYVDKGLARRANQSEDFDFVSCIWVSASEDSEAARRPLAQKVAYYGQAMNPTILSNLGVAKEEFEPITYALLNEQNEDKAINLVTDDMLKIGIVGTASDIIARLEPLVADGMNHLSFGPPLGPDLMEAVHILGQVIRHFKD